MFLFIYICLRLYALRVIYLSIYVNKIKSFVHSKIEVYRV